MILLSASASATKHVVVDISAHGFGHLAQAAAVLNALECKNIRLTVRSVAPIDTLKERIRHPFELVRYQQDNGMIMHDALRVDEEKTMKWYREFHANYEERKSEAASELDALGPDLVFSDVPYLGLDAASIVGVPSVALCSLNWADIFRSYCGHYADYHRIHDDILNAYSQADVFLQPEPSMPMEDLLNTRPISPLAFMGNRRSEALQSATKCTDQTKFVLIGVGGVGIENFPLEQWPKLDNVCWIFPDGTLAVSRYARRPDFVAQSQIDLCYIDLLSSCDLILTKTGYGTQTEAVVNQIPAICISRHDWPEHIYLANWHKQNGEVEFIQWDDVGTPLFRNIVVSMLGRTSWTKEPVVPQGAEEAAHIIYHHLNLN